ncbi:MAG TPA: methylated-DNA--[protein]-cysteine S-methyltransferase [Alphaproteobacteria bacterium]|jgi:methylated-DNA-[protein]-cysteine S-methyltransferase|nr:methylated-DNA--[protein]-cysteine S-methyltransferase [Alphaproteobacteria bacterium]MDP6272107.1 methylated-DNA--[protein]-cysteine S-methyltransferase [Alphaproteobacteria bacterium]HJM51300.1 methylated-DNA--[protein]-cysteine S-methyltransferase [Alphaproteobacteria bacterium]
MKLLVDEITSPMGTMLLVSDGAAVVTLDFADCRQRLEGSLARRFGPFELRPAADPGGFSSAVRRYFAGDLGAVAELPVRLAGTPFQETVWAALRSIPVGATTTYGELAAGLGRPGAARAVGRANALNPVGIAVPCHRVIGADGSLTGYAGGIERKRWLLEHEGVVVAGLG